MRTFIALEPPAELRRAIGWLNRDLGEGLRSMKWVRPEHIHLTLRFLGEIDPRRAGEVGEAVAGAAGRIPPFDLKVSGVGHFGPPRSPRVLWLGLADQPLLAQLATGIENRLVASGFGRADKPFRAHLTLARAGRESGPPPDWDQIRQDTPSEWPRWSASEVAVIKSTLTPQGPIYEILSSHKFAG